MSDKHNFKREVKFLPAFDKRSFSPKKDQGIHGVDMRFYLRGDKGVVQFTLYTNWHLPTVDQTGWPDSIKKPNPAHIGYHSLEAIYENQRSVDTCQLLPGNTCYSDVSYLMADRVFDILVAQGCDGLWKYLEDYYKETFFPNR